MTAIASIVIVGAGQAGAMAAAALRELGFAGRIVLLGAEPHPPYERPPLSKAVLCQPQEPVIDILTAAACRERSIELITGSPASALDPAGHRVTTADGRSFPFDRCLLATGGNARELPAFPRGARGIHYLRTLDDARRLRAALAPAARVVVVGGGVLGLELASSARHLQAEVDVLEAAPRLLERLLPAQASEWLARRVRSSGVRLHLGTGLQSARAPATEQGRWLLRSDTGRDFEADAVVIAVGLAPETTLARQAGLDIDPVNGGIRIDEQCLTSHADVYAAGDCTSRHRTPARLESWQNANEQGRAAAAAMLGLPAPLMPFTWFWTDQFDCNIQMLGLPATDLAYALRGAAGSGADGAGEGSGKLIWCGHREGVPVHGVAVNAGGDLRHLRLLFERGLPLDVTAFADESVAIKTLVSAARQTK